MPGRPVHLVAGEGVEIDVEILDVDVEVHRALAAIGQHRDAARMGERDDLLHRRDGAEHVGHVGDCDDLRARRQQRLEGLEVEGCRRRATGAHLITAPLRSRRKCQGTMLE